MTMTALNTLWANLDQKGATSWVREYWVFMIINVSIMLFPGYDRLIGFAD